MELSMRRIVAEMDKQKKELIGGVSNVSSPVAPPSAAYWLEYFDKEKRKLWNFKGEDRGKRGLT